MECIWLYFIIPYKHLTKGSKKTEAAISLFVTEQRTTNTCPEDQISIWEHTSKQFCLTCQQQPETQGLKEKLVFRLAERCWPEKRIWTAARFSCWNIDPKAGRLQSYSHKNNPTVFSTFCVTASVPSKLFCFLLLHEVELIFHGF